MWAIGLLSLTHAMFIVAMFVGLTPAQLSSSTPIPHIVFGANFFGTAGTVTLIVMSILTYVTSFNSGLLNTSRFSYAMETNADCFDC